MVLNKKGFTLIELMVAIAVIGILAGVVVAGLNNGKVATKDARIKAAMTQVRLLAQQMRNDDFTYISSFVTPYSGVSCGINGASDADLRALALDIKTLNGVTNCATASTGVFWINAPGGSTGFAATAKLASGTFWCIDSTGADKGGYATRVAALDDNNDLTCN